MTVSKEQRLIINFLVPQALPYDFLTSPPQYRFGQLVFADHTPYFLFWKDQPLY